MFYRLGFTGTQRGMTKAQKHHLILLLHKHQNDILEFHHGDCIGADADAHQIAVAIFGNADKIWIHPPLNPAKRAFCQSPHMLPEKDYLERNRDIIDTTNGVIAAPETMEERRRSGTWYTIRYAKRLKRPYLILEP